MNGHAFVMSPAGPHRYAVRVYFEDTDAGGIVYHANYLRFAERARTEALRDMGIPHAELVERYNLMFVVRRAKWTISAPPGWTTRSRANGARPRRRRVDDAASGVSQIGRGRAAGRGGVAARLRPAAARSGPMRIPARWRDGLLAMGTNGG